MVIIDQTVFERSYGISARAVINAMGRMQSVEPASNFRTRNLIC
jgi:hypothetical protein